MNLHATLRQLLQEITPGQSQMTNTTYDTAWIARLNHTERPIADAALEWLRNHQLEDGSWGSAAFIYNHDRVICTLAAMISLAKRAAPQDHPRVQKAAQCLPTYLKNLSQDVSGETIAFSMLLPVLLAEAKTLGILPEEGKTLLAQMHDYRQDKLAGSSHGVINRHVSMVFSAEMAGTDGLQLLDRANLQETNGSIGFSPSATAYFLLHVDEQNQAAKSYLRQIVSSGGVPNVYPIDIFEASWVLWNVATIRPNNHLLTSCQPALDFLQNCWRAHQGVGYACGYAVPDSDETGVVYKVLKQFGRTADLQAILHFEEKDHFRCFPLEANPSLSANVHVLDALRYEGLPTEHPSVQKVLQFLQKTRTPSGFWIDKWHVSPYYVTAHAIIATVGYADELSRAATEWILSTQKADGSWGYYVATAEETAYCLQALMSCHLHGYEIPPQVFQRGGAWLLRQMEPSYAPLWIGKCLYCPTAVVRATILTTLIWLQQTGYL